MRSEEVFYLHVDGQQRGPYTIRHIDHLLNSGLITEDALFLREGMEQWLPVTELVARRKPKDRWRWLFYAVPATLVFVVCVLFFGPPARDGWREVFQHDFTPRAAYWRARDVVRSRGLGEGSLLRFEKFGESKVKLRENEGADVVLKAQVTDPNGQVREVRWKVSLRFDPERREWSGEDLSEIN